MVYYDRLKTNRHWEKKCGDWIKCSGPGNNHCQQHLPNIQPEWLDQMLLPQEEGKESEIRAKLTTLTQHGKSGTVARASK